jgi:hypothetical protein
MEPLCSPLIIERAHWISGPQSDHSVPPRALVMKFFNYTDKIHAVNAALAKVRELANSCREMLFPDLSMEIHKQ